jgi:amidase
MPLDYTALLQSHQNEQRETIRNTKETSNWLLDSSEIPHSTNVHGFIETKLSPLELEITNSSVPELLRNLQIFKWKSRTVLLAFLHRAILAQQLVNPVAEFYIEESLKRADDLDKYYETHGKPIGELHGLPVSIKEEFDLLGQRTTLSLINQHDSEVSKQTSPNLEPLIQQGANIFLKTNVPIGAFNIVTHNNLYGITSNPYNTNFTAGGSSGGEAALLALRGSPLGVGADLGGSIRQPSSFNGLFGIKPSSGRVPHNNSKIVVRGMESLKGTNGALANDIDALSIYLKSIIDSEPWLRDTNVVPLPWDEKKAKGKIGRTLKFAVLLDDGLIRPTPAVERALSYRMGYQRALRSISDS